jgi:hypothetical protein
MAGFAPLADIPSLWLNPQMPAACISIFDDETPADERLRKIVKHKPVEKADNL